MAMRRIKELILSFVIASTFIGIGAVPALAAPYGSGAYNSSYYSADPSGSTAGSSANNPGSPNTGLAPQSLVLAGIAGFIGFSVLSFVTIRLLHINRAKN